MVFLLFLLLQPINPQESVVKYKLTEVKQIMIIESEVELEQKVLGYIVIYGREKILEKQPMIVQSLSHRHKLVVLLYDLHPNNEYSFHVFLRSNLKVEFK